MHGQRGAARDNEQVEVAGEEVVQLRRVAAVGHVLHRHAQALQHHQHRDVGQRGRAVRAVGDAPRPRAGGGDELGDVTRAVIAGDHREGEGADEADRCEILDPVRQVALDHRVDGQRRARGHQQRVAVGLRARHRLGAHDGVAAGPVLDLHGAAERGAHPLGHQAREHVGAAAVRSLLECLRAIAASRNKTVSQVAINWCICKETIPIPGAKSAAQAAENIGALGWKLDSGEMAELDKAAANVDKKMVQNIFQTR